MSDSTSPFTAWAQSGGDFFQQFAKALPEASTLMAKWVEPTMDSVDLNKRIKELQIIQFWLEQNVKLVQVSIQALEVQRMTLAALEKLQVIPRETAATKSNDPLAPEHKTVFDPLTMWQALGGQFQKMMQETQASAATPAQNKEVPEPESSPKIRSRKK